MVTSASQWKSKNKSGEHELELPSGNTALVRRIKPEAFLEGGLIPDPLTSMVMQAVNSKRGLPPAKLQEVASDPAKLAAAMEMFDRVLCYTVIEPPVEMPPVCTVEGCGVLYNGGEGVHVKRSHKDYHRFQEAPRDAALLYADDVDLEDKQFIFQWCVGGVSDVKRFREELASNVGAISESEDIQE